MKPFESFLLSTTLAANSISIADENSAEANSFNTKQLLSGLNFLHDQGIFHRDLKPNNIFVTYSGTDVEKKRN